MKKERVVTTAAAAMLPAAFCLLLAACGDGENSATFDEINSKKIVTFSKDDAEGDAPNTMFKDICEKITIPGPGNMTKVGYYFVGWNASGRHYNYDNRHERCEDDFGCYYYGFYGTFREGDVCTVKEDVLFTASWSTSRPRAAAGRFPAEE